MMTLEIYLDVARSGRVMAHLLEPPGLGVRFESRREMERRLLEEIRSHLSWLVSHGEPVPAVEKRALRIAEEARMAGDFESGDDVGFYTPDALPASPEEVEHNLRIGGYAHADLLALVEGLDGAALDWVRDDGTRSIGKVIRHVVGAELWYATRIIDDPEIHGMPEGLSDADRRIDATEDVLERLRIAWPAFQRWARSLPPELRSRVVTPTWFTERKDERWTARKMLRRCIEHCREHTRSIERILAAYRNRAT